MISYYDFRDKPILFAHRGMNSFAPENSLPAFELCLKNDIPAIELDVHLIKSGELVVIHDSATKRVTNEDYIVENLTLSEVKKLDIGKNFNKNFGNTQIPTLEEVFQLCSNNILYDIEIKTNKLRNKELTTKLWDLIKKYKLEFNTIITSFNPFVVREFEQISKHSLLEGIIFANEKSVPLLLRKGLGSRFFQCNIMKPDIKLVNQTTLSRYRERNLKILPWCVDTEEQVDKLLNQNIFGIVSNVPEKMIQTELFRK